MKKRRDEHRENVKTLRGHVEKLDARIAAHQLTKKRTEKLDEISIAKGDLQSVVEGLSQAKKLLESKISRRDDVVSALQSDLNGNDEKDDGDGGEDDE